VSSIWHRQTARVLPVDDEGRVLLLHGWDPHRPDQPFWFTIGGAADPGESLRDAGARELYEETRISVEPERLGEPIAQNSIEFSWAGRRIAQEQTFYAVAVGSVTVSLEGLDHWERATTDKYPGSRPKTSKPMSAPPTSASPISSAPRWPASAGHSGAAPGNSRASASGSPTEDINCRGDASA